MDCHLKNVCQGSLLETSIPGTWPCTHMTACNPDIFKSSTAPVTTTTPSSSKLSYHHIRCFTVMNYQSKHQLQSHSSYTILSRLDKKHSVKIMSWFTMTPLLFQRFDEAIALYIWNDKDRSKKHVIWTSFECTCIFLVGFDWPWPDLSRQKTFSTASCHGSPWRPYFFKGLKKPLVYIYEMIRIGQRIMSFGHRLSELILSSLRCTTVIYQVSRNHEFARKKVYKWF